MTPNETGHSRGTSQEGLIEQALGKAFDAYAVTLESMKKRNAPLALPSQHEPLRSAIADLAGALRAAARTGDR